MMAQPTRLHHSTQHGSAPAPRTVMTLKGYLLAAKSAADRSLPGIPAAVLRMNTRAEDFSSLLFQFKPRKVAAPEGAIALSGRKCDLEHVKCIRLRVKGRNDLDVLLIELFGIGLIIKKVTLPSFGIRQQGIFAGSRFYDFAHEGMGLFLCVLLSHGRLLFLVVGVLALALREEHW